MTNDENILAIYLKDINRIPLLSHEEEAQLAIKAKARAEEKRKSEELNITVDSKDEGR